jgi:hypothetical protein
MGRERSGIVNAVWWEKLQISTSSNDAAELSQMTSPAQQDQQSLHVRFPCVTGPGR